MEYDYDNNNNNINILSSLNIHGVNVTSWAVEVTSNSNHNGPIDEFFSVNLHYQDHTNHSAETLVTFSIPKESNAHEIFSIVFNVLEILDDPNGKSYDCAIDVVVESCESLIEEVSQGLRRSLAMNVHVEVLFRDDNDGDDDVEPMYDDHHHDDIEPMYDDHHHDDIEPMYDDHHYDMSRGENCEEDEDEDESMDDEDGDAKVCAICLATFVKSRDDVLLLCCSHNFHKNCLMPWVFRGKNSCPLCRSEIMVDQIVEIDHVEKVLKV